MQLNIKLVLLFILCIVQCGCKVLKRNEDQESGKLDFGNNSININEPSTSIQYETSEITKNISTNYNTFVAINYQINKINSYEQMLDLDLVSGSISRKNYLTKKEKVKNIRIAVLKNLENCQKALDLWSAALDKKLKTQESKNNYSSKDRIISERLGSAKQIAPANDTCYQVTKSNKYPGITFRNRPITDKEIAVCNSCYNLDKDCTLKEKLDAKTQIGILHQGDSVQKITTQGKFYKIIDLKSGRMGYMRTIIAGVNTLEKVKCK